MLENAKMLLEKGKLKYVKMKSFMMFLIFVFLIFIEIVVLIGLAADFGFETAKNIKDGFIKNTTDIHIARIEMTGVIDSKLSKRILKNLESANSDDSVKEILFVVNSPGGSPTASFTIAEALRASDKNITLYVQDVAASGGYYVASSIKPLYVNKHSILGSIGVIMPHYNAGKLAEKIGVEEDNVVAGKYKVPLSMFKKSEGKSLQLLKNNLLEPTYNAFIEDVARYREVNTTDIIPYAEGRIFAASKKSLKGILYDEIIDEYSLMKKMKSKYKDIDFIEYDDEKTSMFLPKIELNLQLKGLLPLMQ